MDEIIQTRLIGCIVGLIGVSIVIWYFNTAYRKKIARFATRENMSTENIYEKYFADSGIPKDIVIQLWNELAFIIELPKEKLRPSDRFLYELAPEKGFDFDDPMNGFHMYLKKKLQMLGHKSDISTINTVNDYIHIFGTLQTISRSKKGSL